MEFSPNIQCKLKEYSDLILKWNKKINLISRSTESDIWERHINDSAQIFRYLSCDDTICDIGTGAGLPGIVLSIMGIKNTLLVESDLRKSVFLNQAKNISSNQIKVINERIENLDENNLPKIDYVTSRALADINKLLEFSSLLSPSKAVILLKGKNYKKELEDASKNWHFECEEHESLTNPESVILIINELRKN